MSDAERARRRAIREAEAELSRCQSAYDREVAAARQGLDAALCDVNSKGLGKCHDVTLFERIIARRAPSLSSVREQAGRPPATWR